ncbi:voltage-gated potassium channel [Methanohalophilus levihalophilus]|uniref:potassium channel family protein n=1 Tax=Methanohalophilus levihalophilus TaxID=1431282 RepID=UPI001AE83139|nr:potassium channel protein [Methanohalophilus levihalophilus]MBP2029726.1 voltage-gated potassium channel [Methanohalophilus levihalophilus]
MELPSILRKPLAKHLILALSVIIIHILLFLYFASREGQIEYVNVVDATYWVISTVTTVGYGDIVLTSMGGKIFTMIVQLTGVTMVFGILISFVVTPWFEKSLHTQLPRKAPPNLADHIIICGYNRLVETLIEELTEQNVDFLIVEEDEGIVESIAQRKLPCILGSSTSEEVLKNASIENARFLIANGNDEENANIVLTATNFADVYIIAVADEMSNVKYLKYAGADKIVSPKLVLGRFLGNKAVDPCSGNLGDATNFFDGYSIVELPIYPGSELLGKSLGASKIEEETGASIIGLRKSGVLTFEIKPTEIIRENSVLLATGTLEQLSYLKQMTRGGTICKLNT